VLLLGFVGAPGDVQRWVGPSAQDSIGHRLQADDAVGVGDEASDIGWRHGCPADRRQIIFGDRTGHCASLSNEHRDRVVPRFRHQLANRWDAESLERLPDEWLQHFGCVTQEHDASALPGLE
jgi:hypothetical protein